MAQFSFNTFNTERIFTRFDSSNLPADKKDKYRSLEQLYKKDGAGTIYEILAVYVGGETEFYKENPMVAIPMDDYNRYVNIPQHQLDEIKAIIDSRAAVSAINNGFAGFSIETYTKKIGNKEKVFYKAVWCDRVPDDEDDDEDGEIRG